MTSIRFGIGASPTEAAAFGVGAGSVDGAGRGWAGPRIAASRLAMIAIIAPTA